MVVRLCNQYTVDKLARNQGMGVAGQDHIDAGDFIGQELDEILIAAIAVCLIQTAMGSHDDNIRTCGAHLGYIVVGSGHRVPKDAANDVFRPLPVHHRRRGQTEDAHLYAVHIFDGVGSKV